MRRAAVSVLVALLASAFCGSAAAGEAAKEKPHKIVVTPDRRDAIYGKGETATFAIAAFAPDGQAVTEGKLRVRLRGDVRPHSEREIVLKPDQPEAERSVAVKLDRPGWIHVVVNLFDADGKPIKTKDNKDKPVDVVGQAGAMVAPLEIAEAIGEPEDFDAFWARQRALLDAVPVKATLTPVEPAPERVGKWLLYDVKIDCAGAMPVSGYMSVPVDAAPQSLAAAVSYDGAGVRDSHKNYRPNAISLAINAHGIENGQPAEYYRDLVNGELRDYRFRGWLDPETFYFRDMFLRVMRSLDYVKTLPEWNGRDLVAIGGSQGGGQALAAAGLDPAVTLCVAGVPALADHNGPSLDRSTGWPHSLRQKGISDEDRPRISATLGYFDGVNFAKRIRCETFISTGFIDTVCPPTAAYAVLNQIPAGVPKTMTATPNRGHNAQNTAGQRRLTELLNALKAQ